MRGVLSTPHAPCSTPRLTSIAGSGSKMAPVGPSEEELGRAWDRCLVDTAFKSGNPSDVLMRELILYSFKFVFSFLLSSGWTDCWNSLFIRLVQEWVPYAIIIVLVYYGMDLKLRSGIGTSFILKDLHVHISSEALVPKLEVYLEFY